MNPGIKNKLLTGAVIVLVAVCIAQGIIIYRHTGAVPRSFIDRDVGSFLSRLKDKFGQEKKNTGDMFDRFFSDDFFSHRDDPFKDMERLHRQMQDMMEKDMKDPFNRSWDSWFNDRFLGGDRDIAMRTTEKKDAYIIQLEIPNLKDNKLNITIDSDGISVDGNITQLAEKKDADGHVINRQEIHRTLSRTFPMPGDADYKQARVDNRKDEITITLPKKIS